MKFNDTNLYTLRLILPFDIDLMHQYNVGVQVKTVYEVKEIDNDFFEGE